MLTSRLENLDCTENILLILSISVSTSRFSGTSSINMPVKLLVYKIEAASFMKSHFT